MNTNQATTAARLLVLMLAGACGLAQALELSPQGVGPLTGATAFTQQAIQAALPAGYVVKAGSASSEGEKRKVFQVFEGGKQVMRIEGNAAKVAQIVVESAAIATPRGVKVGAAYKTVYPDLRAACTPGSEEDSDTVFCEAGKLPSISYQFAGPLTASTDGMPPLKALAGWKISRIIWSANP